MVKAPVAVTLGLKATYGGSQAIAGEALEVEQGEANAYQEGPDSQPNDEADRAD